KNLINIFAALSDRTAADVCREYGGQGFAGFKKDLAELSVSVLGPITEEMNRLCEEKTYIDQILKEGSEKARILSEPILKDVHNIVGFLQS
ncbi:MAG: hypothetical protein JKY59_06330, partial [Emcibacter sp.]|nr:hypothetical protein [Emcibacter sp.]